MSTKIQSPSENSSGLDQGKAIVGAFSVNSLADKIKEALFPEMEKLTSQKISNQLGQVGKTQDNPEVVTIRTNSESNRKRSFSNSDLHTAPSDNESGELNYSDTDEETDIPLSSPKNWEPSDKTISDVTNVTKKSMIKQDRRSVFQSFPFTRLQSIVMPKLDDSFAQILRQRRIKTRYIQGLPAVESIQKTLLFSTSPLLHLHTACVEASSQGSTLDAPEVLHATNAAIALLGNANSQAIFERRKLYLNAIHKDLPGYASRDTSDVNSSELFGHELRLKIKEAIDLNKEFNQFANSITPCGFYFYIEKFRYSNVSVSMYLNNSYVFIAKRGKFSGNTRGSFNSRQNYSSHQQPRHNSNNRGRFDPKGKSFRGAYAKSSGTVTNNFVSSPRNRRLCHNLEFWESSTNDTWVLNTVKAYRLPFISKPPTQPVSYEIPIPIGSHDLVTAEINKMVLKGAVE
ncbi:unnamed protein product, partial [Allacma fusca]